jgi:hypothetical protein
MTWLSGIGLTLAASLGAHAADEIQITRLRTHADVVAAYCEVETGTKFESCGAQDLENKLDILYLPVKLGAQVVSHLESAYGKGYYRNLDKIDLFHGHPMSHSSKTNYENASAFFADLDAILYHSAEYLDWQDIPLEQSPFAPHGSPERSFVGWLFGPRPVVTAAIDLVPRDATLRTYRIAGSISMDELSKSLEFSDGTKDVYVNTCTPNEANCKPCKLFPMMHMFENPNGRFHSPDGKTFEIFFHCKYK